MEQIVSIDLVATLFCTKFQTRTHVLGSKQNKFYLPY